MSDIIVNVTLSNLDGNWCVSDGYIFSLEDIKRLRQLGICGVLTGTLGTLAQQNVFLSVPLRLLGEEVLWIITNGHGRLNVTQSSTVPLSLRSTSVREQVRDDNATLIQRSFALQRDTKLKEHLSKTQKYGQTGAVPGDPALFQETPNDSLVLKHTRRDPAAAAALLLASSLLRDQYCHQLDLFSYLKRQNFVVSPGARFGGKYIIYPGDPLRYHSHLIVADTQDYHRDPLDFSAISAGARLATAVKKTWVLNAQIPETREITCFSVEWAGFG
ncbi:hypothetical protein HG535_0E03880 [Zygotorulaspora mrakii]|uniref:tRNA-splicing endonuclease subunit Sen34 n=1 Tax=Zygotorulaspora mrakii TaxID=42260 RepID=A0A7H9B4L7_ZYGMR|nr:uncharacterized protein HG535_0E03880 [Zygotorulaspora mrakii]QLG73304.1 hypothetical protein HG535_0E03880 [Zygotorulaspora mrakii]